MIVNHAKLGQVEITCQGLNVVYISTVSSFTFNRVLYSRASMHLYCENGKAVEYNTDDKGQKHFSRLYLSRDNHEDVTYKQRQVLEKIFLEIAQAFFADEKNLLERCQGNLVSCQKDLESVQYKIQRAEDELAALRQEEYKCGDLVSEAEYWVEKHSQIQLV